jgi:tetrahydromethanopterin S-methyltransferase subunit G
MGLFKKRTTDTGELDHLRSEIAAMAARLDAADSEKAQLEQRLHQISAAVQQPVPPPPPPPEPVISQGDLDMMRARIQRLYDRLDDSASQQQLDPAAVEELAARVDRLAIDVAVAASTPAAAPTIDADEYAALRSRVDALQARLETPIAPPPPPPTTPPEPEPAVDPAELDEIRARIEALHDRVTTMDARVTSISTELANQLTELSGDVDALSRREPAEPVPATDLDGVVDEIRDAQTRLANEQARYQIAFRQDLADLAERLRRP